MKKAFYSFSGTVRDLTATSIKDTITQEQNEQLTYFDDKRGIVLSEEAKETFNQCSPEYPLGDNLEPYDIQGDR